MYTMRKETFKIGVEPDGTEFIFQNIDEMDKNHSYEDPDKTKDGKIYATNGK